MASADSEFLESTKDLIKFNELPDDASNIVQRLKAGRAFRRVWIRIAREYFNQGRFAQFCLILEGAVHVKYGDGEKESRRAILNALGAYYTYLGKMGTNQREKDLLLGNAMLCYSKSSSVRRGQLFLAQGRYEEASSDFDAVLLHEGENVRALLGKACSQLNLRRYYDSLKLFEKALDLYEWCPGAVRLGMGLCYYKMGLYEDSKKEFQEILQEDPENVEALVAYGILDLQQDEADCIMSELERKYKAFEICPCCATSMKCLTNHFFFAGIHFLAKEPVTNESPAYRNTARSDHNSKLPEVATFLRALQKSGSDRVKYVAGLALEKSATATLKKEGASVSVEELRAAGNEFLRAAQLFSQLPVNDGMQTGAHLEACQKSYREANAKASDIVNLPQFEANFQVAQNLALADKERLEEVERPALERERARRERANR